MGFCKYCDIHLEEDQICNFMKVEMCSSCYDEYFQIIFGPIISSHRIEEGILQQFSRYLFTEPPESE